MLLLELEEGLFRLWPYSDEARYFRQTEGYRCLGYAAANLGQDREAQRLAKQSIALAEQIGVPLLKIGDMQVLAYSLVFTGDCRQAENPA